MNWREIERNFYNIPVPTLVDYFIADQRNFLQIYDEEVLPYELAKLPPEYQEFARMIFESSHSENSIREAAFKSLNRRLLFPNHIAPEMVVNPELHQQLEQQITDLNAFSQEVTEGVQVKRRTHGHPSFLVFTTDKEEEITLQTLVGHSDPDNQQWYNVSTYWGFLKPEGLAKGHYDGNSRDHLTVYRNQENQLSTYRL
jgi:hypothetical protein